jgi:hypothetical protein
LVLQPTGGKAITSYSASSSPSISLTTTGTTSPLTVTGTYAALTDYSFTLQAVNANGTSTSSGSSNAVTPVPGSFEAFATVTLGSNSNTLTFSAIPSTYYALQFRYYGDANTSNFGSQTYYTINSANTNYQISYGTADGGGTAASGIMGHVNYYFNVGFGAGVGYAESAVIDIHDYANTSFGKTYVGLYSGANKGVFSGGNQQSTSAITSITVTNSGTVGWKAGSVFALYGWKKT